MFFGMGALFQNATVCLSHFQLFILLVIAIIHVFMKRNFKIQHLNNINISAMTSSWIHDDIAQPQRLGD